MRRCIAIHNKTTRILCEKTRILTWVRRRTRPTSPITECGPNDWRWGEKVNCCFAVNSSIHPKSHVRCGATSETAFVCGFSVCAGTKKWWGSTIWCAGTAQVNSEFFRISIANCYSNSLLHEFCIRPLYTAWFHPIAEPLWCKCICKCKIIKSHINIDFGTHFRSIAAHLFSSFYFLRFPRPLWTKENEICLLSFWRAVKLYYKRAIQYDEVLVNFKNTTSNVSTPFSFCGNVRE